MRVIKEYLGFSTFRGIILLCVGPICDCDLKHSYHNEHDITTAKIYDKVINKIK